MLSAVSCTSLASAMAVDCMSTFEDLAQHRRGIIFKRKVTIHNMLSWTKVGVSHIEQTCTSEYWLLWLLFTSGYCSPQVIVHLRLLFTSLVLYENICHCLIIISKIWEVITCLKCCFSLSHPLLSHSTSRTPSLSKDSIKEPMIMTRDKQARKEAVELFLHILTCKGDG